MSVENFKYKTVHYYYPVDYIHNILQIRQILPRTQPSTNLTLLLYILSQQEKDDAKHHRAVRGRPHGPRHCPQLVHRFHHRPGLPCHHRLHTDLQRRPSHQEIPRGLGQYAQGEIGTN